MGNRAFTYIEVLMAVIILGFILIPLLSQFYIGFQGNKYAELVTQATDLGNDLMEEIEARRFDENIFPDEPVSPAQLGVDAGENANNRATFDDVDDYNNYHDTPPKAIDGTALTDFAQFGRSVSVDYVALSGTTWIHSATTTYYKRVKVIVTHPKISTVNLETIVVHF